MFNINSKFILSSFSRTVIKSAIIKLPNNTKIAQRCYPSVNSSIIKLNSNYARFTCTDKTRDHTQWKYYSTDKVHNNDFMHNLRNIYTERKNTFLLGLFLLTGTLIYSTIGLSNKSSEKKVDIKSVAQNKDKRKIEKVPSASSVIPDHVPYLLIGGGTASFSAFRAIKSTDPYAKVLVISNEGNYPYMRPPLSKEIWLTDDRNLRQSLKFKQWNGSERSLFYEPDDFYVKCEELPNVTNGGVAVARGWMVTKIDPINRIAYLDDNKAIRYDKCLIATGASPKNLDVFEKANDKIKEKITLFRTIYDFQDLEDICSKAETIAVIGGGFLGSEISCALARYGKNKKLNIKQIFNESGNMAKVLPEYISQWTTQKVRAEGVEVIPGVLIKEAELNDKNKIILGLDNGSTVEVDHVIVAVGVKPNTELAQSSELEVDPQLDGFVVNAELEARSNLYVAGDCACFYDTKLGRRRVEHHDHAVVSGRLAGENMAGAHKPYTHQSMFWSDLGPDIGYEAIGIVDSRLETFSVFAKTESEQTENEISKSNSGATAVNVSTAGKSKESVDTDSKMDDYSKGLIFYLKNNIVVGIVLWNIFNRMSIARQVIKEHKQFDDLSELAKVFNMYEDE